MRETLRLRRALLGLPWMLAWVAAGFVCAQDPPARPTNLAEVLLRLEQTVAAPRFNAASWGVKIASLDTGKVLFQHNAEKLLSPASNCKLYTVALALDRLGVDYRIKTSLYASRKPAEDGTLGGDLIVYGRGDPCINARLNGRDVFRAVQPLVDALTNAGVTRIQGDLVADTSHFRGPEMGSGWAWDDQQYYYGAEVSALTINDNLVVALVKPGANLGDPCSITLDPPWDGMVVSNRTSTVSNGVPRNVSFYRLPSRNVVYVSGQMAVDDKGYAEDVPVHRPAALFAWVLGESLRRNGVALEGRLRVMDWLDREVEPLDLARMLEIGAVESRPLREIAAEIQKPSQNLYTDLLLAHVGESKRSNATPSRRTSEELGVRELSRFLGELGIPKSQYYFEEGSGLSRNNLASPSATVTLLRHMASHKASSVYQAALPVAGVDGTLRNRMKGTAAAGNVRAKTGSLRWANSLSGYVSTAAGEKLVFSLMLNRYQGGEGALSARLELDEIAVLLAGLAEKSG